MKKSGDRNLWAERRKSLKPTAISVTGENLVRFSTLGDGETLPLIIEPTVEDLSLPLWVADNISFIESRLLKHGGLLFRNFGVRTQGDFEDFLDAFDLPQMVYMEAATPRTKLSEKVYTSTEFPPEQTIALHNELSYVKAFPMKIWFCCLQPAECGGETPIGDARGVYQRVPAAIRERFIERGWRLTRNFGDGFGPTWRRSYHVDDVESAERYFREADIEFEWLGGERLRTKQARPAVARHPRTGEAVWFNHIVFWHVSSLDARLREMLLAEFGEEGLPYNTYYGDGSPIEESVIEHLREAYRQETVAFPWRKGDVLMLDNMLTAHGRMPFEGSRRVLAAMGEPLLRTDV